MKAFLLLLALLAPLVSACTALPTASEPGKVEVLDDPFRPFIEYQTAYTRGTQWQLIVSSRLAGRIDRKTRAITTLVFVEVSYVTFLRRNYEKAFDAQARELKLTKHVGVGKCMGKDECPHGETFSVAIPLEILRGLAGQPYAIKLFAKAGPEFTISIPDVAIRALLARLDRDAVAAPPVTPRKA